MGRSVSVAVPADVFNLTGCSWRWWWWWLGVHRGIIDPDSPTSGPLVSLVHSVTLISSVLWVLLQKP